MEINKTFLLGNLTRDPDVRYLPSGTMVAEFDLAVNRTYKDKNGETKRETLFIRIETMGKTAEFVSEYLKKGRRVYVEGRLRSNSWESKDGQKRTRIDVFAERIQFADSRPAGEQRTAPEAIGSTNDAEDLLPDDSLPSIDNDEGKAQTKNDLPF